jgi:hypothetical protein
MREDSCIGCLFSEDDGMTMILKDLPGISQETMRCVHPDEIKEKIRRKKLGL